MKKLKNLVEKYLHNRLYQAECVLRSDTDKNITIITDNLRGVCGITVVTVAKPAEHMTSNIERTVLKVKFFMLEPTMRDQLVRMANEARKIDGVFSFIPKVRSAERVISRIYRPGKTAVAEE
tara:strand:- start:75 stop:440 length:366 start_codon:yes stop_codon:yes gene_type:complete